MMILYDQLPIHRTTMLCYRNVIAALLIINFLCLLISGCATWEVPAEFDDAKLRARAVTDEFNGVRMSAAVLSSEDSLQMFGANVNETGVQPIWIEVENTSPQMLWLLRSGTDPDLFSPLEVAWSFHTAFSGDTNARIDAHFDAWSFQNPIASGTKQSGIIFANPHRQTRLLNVDFLGQGQIFPFTLFPAVPDDMEDERVLAMMKRLAEAETLDYQEMDAFRTRLQHLPCCAKNVNGKEPDDPINIVLIGKFEEISAAVVRRGFRKNELEFDNAQRLFDRKPDVVVRKSGQGGAPSNWMRVWLAPFRYQGLSVFLAQAGRPIGGRFLVSESKDLKLHPNVDEVRNFLIQDMLYSGGLGKLAFEHGVGATAPNEYRNMSGGDRYFTDGLRAILFFEIRPLALSDIEFLDWVPYLQTLESKAATENNHASD